MGMSSKQIEADIKTMLTALKEKGIEKTLEQMKQEIKENVEAGLSMNAIDKGAKYCSKICNNQVVSDYQIIKIYSNLIKELVTDNKNVTNNVTSDIVTDNKNVTNNVTSDIVTLKEAYISLQEQINVLKQENQTLKELVTDNKNVTNNVTSDIVTDNKNVTNNVTSKQEIDGFIIKLEITKTNGIAYKNWYAKKTINKKLHRIYIGKDLKEASEKIKAYKLKHNLTL